MLDRIGRFYRCTRHVPPRQLLRRLCLTAKRQILCRLPTELIGRHRQPLPVSPAPPTALYSARSHLAVFDGDTWWAQQLNRRIPLRMPVDWSASEIEIAADTSTGERLARDDSLRCDRPTHLERLTFHYHEFIEGLPTEVAEQVIRDWIENNPPYQRDFWNDCWNSYAISIRCVVWMQWWAKHASPSSESSQSGFERQFIGSLCEQIRFLTKNLETDICGNHLIKNIRCLLWASRFFQGEEAERWGKIGLSHLWRELDRQFLPDGMHYELSPAYHCQVLGDLLDCASLLDAPERVRLLRELEPAIRCLRMLTHPDGQISLFSDGGLNMVYSPAEYEQVWQQLGCGKSSENCRTSLDHAGYYLLSNDRVWLLADCGPICADALPAHGHADMLSFELDIDGKRMVVDRGVYQYQAGDARQADRSVVNHNTLALAGRDQCELVGSFRIGRRSSATCESFVDHGHVAELIGSHTGFSNHREKIVHRRRFVVTDRTICIEDTVDGPQSEVAAVVRFLLHHDCQLTQLSPFRIRVARDETQCILSSDRPLSIVRSKWSPNFGQQFPTSSIEMTSPEIPCTFNSTFELE